MSELKAVVKELAPGGKPDFPAIFDRGTQVATWNRQHGIAVTSAFILVLISDLVNYFNVYQPMSDGQREDLALEMASDLWWVKMEEIAVFFDGCKKGLYGRVTNRLDPGKIWEMWAEYLDVRNEACELRQRGNQTIIPMQRTGGDSLDNMLIKLAASFTNAKKLKQ